MVEVTRAEQRVMVPCIPNINHSKILEVSRSDLVLKTIWLLQISWYLLQCIARATQHLSISLLELSTIGLVICAFMIQTLWWSKPLDVQSSTPIPINELSFDDEKAARIVRVEEEDDSWGGSRTINTSHRTVYEYKMRVNNDTTTSNKAVIALPIVGIIFGAVHLVAWQFYFHTARERFLWRIFAILVAGTPMVLTAVERLAYWLDVESVESLDWIGYVFWWLKAILILAYAASRIYLIAMSFVSLRHLPESTYPTVQWANYLPHF
jgi:hypothetical protein